jgi:hypothetical protein
MAQKYYCEHEDCGEDISEDGERFQCVGCEGWFCIKHIGALIEDKGVWVCTSCLNIWQNIADQVVG